MGIYILKRKNYGLAEMAVKGAKGMNPVSSIAQDALNNAVANPIEFANQEAKNYTPTVKNAYAPTQGQGTEVQKQYGLVGTMVGAGKGLLKYGKQNAGTMLGVAGFGAGAAGVTYGYNRYQADKAEIENGTRNENGLSTNEKIGTAAVGTGLAAGIGLKTAISHDNAAKKAAEAFQKNSRTIQLHNMSGAQSGVTPTLLRNATNRRNEAAKTLQNLNRTRMGGLVSNKAFKVGRNALLTAGITPGAALLANHNLKKASEQRKANDNLSTSQLDESEPRQYADSTGYVGYDLRNKLMYKPIRSNINKIIDKLNNKPEAESNHPVYKFREAMYAVPVVGSALGRVIKSKLAGGVNALGKSGNAVAQQSYGSLIKQNIQNGTWGNIGNAAVTGITGGTQQLVKGAGNLFTLGRADKLMNSVASGMKEHGGEMGAKAAKFMRNHKTLTIGATGATVGGALFDVSNKVGEGAVNTVTSLDKKTNEFKKNQEMQYQLSQQNKI